MSFNHEMASKEGNYDYVKENFNALLEEANRVINVVKEYLGTDEICNFS